MVQTKNISYVEAKAVNQQRGHSGYGLGQWETTLQCNVSHWLNPYPEWSKDNTPQRVQWIMYGTIVNTMADDGLVTKGILFDK